MTKLRDQIQAAIEDTVGTTIDRVALIVATGSGGTLNQQPPYVEPNTQRIADAIADWLTDDDDVRDAVWKAIEGRRHIHQYGLADPAFALAIVSAIAKVART